MENLKQTRTTMQELLKQNKISRAVVWLGNMYTGEKKFDNNGNIYVTYMDSGDVGVVFNDLVPLIFRTQLVVGYDKSNPTLLKVLRARNQFPSQEVKSIPNHAETHQWPRHDTLFVRREQFYPGGLCLAIAGQLQVKILSERYYLNDGWHRWLDQTLDLTSEIPASGANFVIPEIDDTGVITYNAGASVASRELLQDSDIPAVSSGKYPMAILKVYDGQTEFIQTETDTDILDLRFAFRGSGGGGGTPAGSDTEIQFNEAGAFGADATFTRNSDGSITIGDYESSDVPTSAYGLHQAATGTSLANILQTFGTGIASFISFVRGRGTKASPTAVQADDVIGRVRGRAYDDAGSVGQTSAEIRILANETHDPSGHGTRIEFHTTPDNSTTLTEGPTIENDGLFSMNSKRIVNLADPSSAQDAASKAYVDAEVAGAGGEVLSANRTYYVRTDGDDSHDGLTNSSGGAFLTAAKANAVVATINKNGYNITVQFGAGTWNEDIIINTGIGNGQVTWKGTLTLLESVTSATVAAGSGATAGTVTKTGQFTGDSYGRKLVYFVTDDVYRVIYSNTANALTLADIAASSTTQNVDVYGWGTIIDSITISKPDTAVILQHLQVDGNSSSQGFSLQVDPFSAVEVYECYLGKTFMNSGSLKDCRDSVIYDNTSAGTLHAGYSGTAVLRRCLGVGAHTSSTIITASRGGYILIQGGTYDGDDGASAKATYGIRAWGSASLQTNANGYGNIKIRNCDTGARSEFTSTVIGTAAVSFTNCTANKSADAASYAYMD